jgi:hypothetical protein
MNLTSIHVGLSLLLGFMGMIIASLSVFIGNTDIGFVAISSQLVAIVILLGNVVLKLERIASK